MTLQIACVKREIKLAFAALPSLKAQQLSELMNSQADCVAIFSLSLASTPRSSSPCELLKPVFQRRVGDGPSIVGDCRGRDDGDDL